MTRGSKLAPCSCPPAEPRILFSMDSQVILQSRPCYWLGGWLCCSCYIVHGILKGPCTICIHRTAIAFNRKKVKVNCCLGDLGCQPKCLCPRYQDPQPNRDKSKHSSLSLLRILFSLETLYPDPGLQLFFHPPAVGEILCCCCCLFARKPSHFHSSL
jgi:hypothetical protein